MSNNNCLRNAINNNFIKKKTSCTVKKYSKKNSTLVKKLIKLNIVKDITVNKKINGFNTYKIGYSLYKNNNKIKKLNNGI